MQHLQFLQVWFKPPTCQSMANPATVYKIRENSSRQKCFFYRIFTIASVKVTYANMCACVLCRLCVCVSLPLSSLRRDTQCRIYNTDLYKRLYDFSYVKDVKLWLGRTVYMFPCAYVYVCVCVCMHACVRVCSLHRTHSSLRPLA